MKKAHIAICASAAQRDVSLFLSELFVNRSVVGAGTRVGTLLVHAEGVPCGRTEDLLFGDIVHTYRDAQHGGQRDEVGANVSVANSTMVGSPVIHH